MISEIAETTNIIKTPSINLISTYYESVLNQLKLPDDCIYVIKQYLIKNIKYEYCESLIRYFLTNAPQLVGIQYCEYRDKRFDYKCPSIEKFGQTIRIINGHFSTEKYSFISYIGSYSNEPTCINNILHLTYKHNIEQTHYVNDFILFIKKNFNKTNFKSISEEIRYVNWNNYNKIPIIYKKLYNTTYYMNIIHTLFFIMSIGYDFKNNILGLNCSKNNYLPYYNLLNHLTTSFNNSYLKLTDENLMLVFYYMNEEFTTSVFRIINCILMSNNTNLYPLFESLLKKNIIYTDEIISEHYDHIKRYFRYCHGYNIFYYCDMLNQHLLTVLFNNKDFVKIYHKLICDQLARCPTNYIVKNAKKFSHIILTFEFMQKLIKIKNIKLFRPLFKKHGKYLSTLKNEQNMNLLQIAIKEYGLVQNFVKIMIDSQFFKSTIIKKSDVKNRKVRELFV